jgi:TrmH family RNA methyltransferase
LSHRPDRRHDEIIASAANPLIKHIRSLQRRKTRHQERAFVVEGFRAVDEAVNANVALQTVLVRDDIPQAKIDDRLRRFPLRVATDDAFRAASDLEVPQGILAIVPMPEADQFDTWHAKTSLALIADGIRDPGNLGTLLRSSSGAGVDYVVMADETVDPYNPKVVRSAMGAHFQLPIYQAHADRLNAVLAGVEQVIVADELADLAYDDVDFNVSTAIVVGGEAFGPLGSLNHSNVIAVRIPLARNVESLNAGVAGSLLLFEAARQRRRHAITAGDALIAGK